MERKDINQPTQPDAIVPDVESTTASQETETAGKVEAVVPMVRAYLIDSVRIAPHQSVVVPVQLGNGWNKTEEGHNAEEFLLQQVDGETDPYSLQTDDILIHPDSNGRSHAVVTNLSATTRNLEQGDVLGQIVPAEVVPPTSDEPSDPGLPLPRAFTVRVGEHQKETQETQREEKLRELLVKPDLPEQEAATLLHFLTSHHDMFSLEEGERGETDLIQMEIDTGDNPPKRQPARRMPFAVRPEVARQLSQMQNAGVIEPSRSPWASPVVLVRKRDGTHRFCVDYRALNSVTKPDRFPLPRIDDLLDQLGESKYFSTIDLASGFWQIRMHPAAKEKTAFVTHQGLYEFRVMPFGLTNAPAVFQRLMQHVVCPLNPTTGRDFVSVYLDDILVFSRTLEDHLMHLHTVIHRLKEVGLKLKPTKCRFVQHELEYLGHIVSCEGLKTNPRLVTAVQDFPLPRTVRDIKRFIGLASYYRRFILNFARLARPLHLLTRKGAIFVWSCRCNEAFSALKERLTTAPVLAYPDFTRDFVLETDASIQGLGAVLGQHQNDQKVHPVAYASRALSNAEQRYAVTELETLAVVWGICHFHHYLYGNVVTVFTDHTAVKAVLETPNPSAKHARWWSRVYGRGVKEVKIVYRPGHENRNADALSRHPQLPAPSVGIGEDEVQVFPISAEGRKDCVEVTVEQEQANDKLHGGPDALEVATTDTVTVETGLRWVGGPEITRSPKQLASVGLENAHSTLAGDTTVHQGGEAVATLSEVRTTPIRPELHNGWRSVACSHWR